MKIEVYTAPSCGHCVRAKTHLKNQGLAFEEINAPDHRDALIARLDATGKTYKMQLPKIFIDDQIIGGADELEVYLGIK